MCRPQAQPGRCPIQGADWAQKVHRGCGRAAVRTRAGSRTGWEGSSSQGERPRVPPQPRPQEVLRTASHPPKDILSAYTCLSPVLLFLSGSSAQYKVCQWEGGLQWAGRFLGTICDLGDHYYMRPGGPLFWLPWNLPDNL